MATRKVKHSKDGPVKRSTYPRLDGITPKSLEYFGTKRNVVIFLNEIVKRGGEMRATEALGYEWWDIAELLEADAALQNLVDRQKLFIARKADEILCDRSMNGFEEVIEEHGEIVKKSRKFNDKALLDYLKANHPKYNKDASEDQMPMVEIKRFEVPIK